MTRATYRQAITWIATEDWPEATPAGMPWLAAVDLLARHLTVRMSSQIFRRPLRTVAADVAQVRGIAKPAALTQDDDAPAWSAWTEAQVQMLREAYPTRTAVDIAAELGCTKRRIVNKAAALGLRKNAGWRPGANARSTKPAKRPAAEAIPAPIPAPQPVAPSAPSPTSPLTSPLTRKRTPVVRTTSQAPWPADAPMVITANTKITVAPPLPRVLRTNTHSPY